jgi:hypothetical protein
MRRASTLAAVATVTLGMGCGTGSPPGGPGDVPDDPVYRLLAVQQTRWCQRITSRGCAVYTAPHPQHAAWVDWSVPSPSVFWNERVLTDRQFWITDRRMAHEACHLKHGLQPTWTPEEKEQYAEWCAAAYAGSP